MSLSALAARDATVRTCVKMKWTMVGRVVLVTSFMSVVVCLWLSFRLQHFSPSIFQHRSKGSHFQHVWGACSEDASVQSNLNCFVNVGGQADPQSGLALYRKINYEDRETQATYHHLFLFLRLSSQTDHDDRRA